jgi:hypothetical protein
MGFVQTEHQWWLKQDWLSYRNKKPSWILSLDANELWASLQSPPEYFVPNW